MKRALTCLLCGLGIVAVAFTVMYFFFPDLIVKTAITLARFSAGLSRNEIIVDDHRWVYLDGGTGEVILFIHGYNDSKEGWGDFPLSFKRDHRVIIPDMPGHGENSRVPVDNYGIPDQVKRLDSFTEKIGIRSFHLCGVSMGGAIAAYYASEHPDKVKSLMIMGPFGVTSDLPSVAWRAFERDSSKLLCWKTEEDFQRIIGWVMDHPPYLPRIFVNYAVESGRKNYDFNKKIFYDLLKGGKDILERRLGTIKSPTLIVWGKNDRVFSVSAADVFKRGITNSKVEIIDCGHMVFLDEPDRTRRIYRDFLASVH